MVDSVTSLNRNGLRDWLIQRVTAVLLAAYTLFILGYLLFHPDLQFSQWHDLFNHPFMRISTFLVLIAIALHAYIGMWVVYTDYIKSTWLRLLIQVLTVIAFVAYLGWGFEILWGMG